MEVTMKKLTVTTAVSVLVLLLPAVMSMAYSGMKME